MPPSEEATCDSTPLHHLDQTWLAVLTSLHAKINPEIFETWFRRTALHEAFPERFIIAVPNTFCQSWLDRYYLDILRTSIHESLDLDPEIAFHVNPEVPSFPFAEPSPQGPFSDQVLPRPEEDLLPSGLDSERLGLNPSYTFEQFITGKSNEFAYAAAQGIVESPGRLYNPFFLYGSVGLGKTHLLQAACHLFLERYPRARIQYLPCETFINHFIQALEEGNLNNFRHRYRQVDMLLVDDIHLLANKERTQEEFFHTFNVLYNAQKQIILSSDSLPVEIPDLQDRLVSRFRWGLVAAIEPPDFETRVAILKRKARLRGCDLPDDIAHFIATHIQSNIRELEGAVTKILGVASLNRQPLSPSLAAEALSDFIVPTPPKRYPISDVINAVCKHYGVRLQDLQSKKRTQSIVMPRQVAMFLARELTPLSLDEIGSYFGGRDHSTVLYGIDKVRKMVSENPEVASGTRKITEELQKSAS